MFDTVHLDGTTPGAVTIPSPYLPYCDRVSLLRYEVAFVPTPKLDDVADFLSAPLRRLGSPGLLERRGAAERLRNFGRLRAGLASTELCVVCGAETDVPVAIPVDQRKGYVEGAGQCCAECA
jgi:hypothetical protein